MSATMGAAVEQHAPLKISWPKRPRLNPRSPVKALRRASWRAHASLLPLLHYFEPVPVTNFCVNLQVLWLKALAGARGDTQDYLSYRMLPKEARWLIARPLCWLYPPWHHDAIARRTSFIDGALADLLDAPDATACPHHLISLGAGFDVRPLRLGVKEDLWRKRAVVDDRLVWSEIDLPVVVAQKRSMLTRLTRKRPWLARQLPQAYGGDLASRAGRAVLRRAAHSPPAHREESKQGHVGFDCALLQSSSADAGRRTIFVCEALLMYLPDRASRALLRRCAEVDGSFFVFADRLPGDIETREEAEACLGALGWTLEAWTINHAPPTRGWAGRVRIGGRRRTDAYALLAEDARALSAAGATVSSARHMGVARAVRGRGGAHARYSDTPLQILKVR